LGLNRIQGDAQNDQEPNAYAPAIETCNTVVLDDLGFCA